MAGRTSTRIAHRLGGPAARRRRHRRFALVAVLLLGIAALLLVGGSGDERDDDIVADDTTTTAPSVPADPILAVCAANDAEIDTARRALLGDNEAEGAVEGFLQDAFVDLARERSAAIRALEPPPSPEVLAVLDEFDAVVDAIEADPSIGIGRDPFEAVNQRWQEVGLGGCVLGGGTVAGDE